MMKNKKQIKDSAVGEVVRFGHIKKLAKHTGGWAKKHAVVILISFCFLVIAGGAAFLIAKYNAVAAPGTKIAGNNVSGNNSLSIKDQINQIQSKIQLTLSSRGNTVTAQASDLGITIDMDKTIKQAISTSDNWLNRVNLFGGHNIELSASFDWEQTQKFLNQNFPDLITSPAQNAGVIYDQKAQKFVTQASAEGKVIDMSKMKLIIESLVKNPRSAVSEVAITSSKPAVSDEAATAAADSINSRLHQRINLQINGQTVYFPDPVDIANWAVFTPENGRLSITFDRNKVKEFISTKVQATIPNTPINGKMITSPDGNTVYATVSKGQNGQAINNTDDISLQIISALQDGQPVNLALNTTQSAAQSDKVQTLSDQHWIEANLSTWTITAYNGATPVAQFNNFAKGAAQIDPERATITGLFKVFGKVGGNDSSGSAGPNASYEANLAAGMSRDRSNAVNSNPYGGVCMPNPGGTQASLCSIHYVTYWGPGGYAFHEAWWLTPDQLRTGLSHGCLNMWKGDAKFIYDFSQIGTPVWVHY